MSANGEPLLEVRGAAVEIAGRQIVQPTDLTLERGQLVVVVGPNGAGKSTLVRAAAGIQPTASGTIRWGGAEVRRLRGRRLARLRAFVPQRPRVPDGVRVREAVRIGRSPHVGALRRPTRQDGDAVEGALARAGVSELGERMLSTLSGGELQRVQIAVALAQEAPVLMADEPTSHLDLGATVSVAKLLRSLADEGLGVVLVAHDLALAAAVADTVMVLSGGRAVATGPPREALCDERLTSVWGVDAGLDFTLTGRTALRVDWLGGERPAAAHARPGHEVTDPC